MDMEKKKTVPPGVGVELFHSMQDPLIVVTPDGEIVDVNPAMLKVSGKNREDVVGQGICKIIHGGRWPHIKCPLEEFLLTRSSRVEDTRLPGLDGEYSLSVIPVKKVEDGRELILLMARKLTRDEVRKVESIRTAQLAAIGELAAGVAHEVNNPINGIINFAQLLLDESDQGSEQAELLTRIVREGERIAAIIYNLLSFAREDGNDFVAVDLNEVLKESLSLVQHQLEKDGIQVSTQCYQPSCLIVGNFLQMQQVVLNLISNSRYALNERYGGGAVEGKKILITCAPVDLASGKCIRLVVKDEGTGIPQGILEKVFEPFFTSKPAGKGSGLGLSISYGIIKNHNGILRVNSILNRYTEMIIEIPASEL